MSAIFQIIAGFFVEIWLLLRRKERDLEENSVIGTSEFEREFSWSWAVVFGLPVMIWAGFKYWF
ncbi:MAG TPA: hypothetical protein VG796_03500 [Verrucomicrobiales bacterium]|jgi:hypothetical protein|nr:hypothetical protein [Verrucomicrobiales bacterium]